MRTFKIFALLTLLTLFAPSIFAQGNEANPNLIDSFYESGKIKVVIAGVGLVLAILLVYLVRLDRKIKKFEQNK